MKYIDIIEKLDTEKGAGKLNLEGVIKQFFHDITGFDVRGVDIQQKDNYYNAIIYYYLPVFGGLPITDIKRAQFNDIKFFIKKFGKERYDYAWRKLLHENLISVEDKKQLEIEIREYSDSHSKDVM